VVGHPRDVVSLSSFSNVTFESLRFLGEEVVQRAQMRVISIYFRNVALIGLLYELD